ncbi:hypothetical protein HPB48_020349 [Haemaphysalis longicornis]|uniref:Uncharacterized protein n=1 Tax=Haemaphysalis longicornis TaxID=44386 RepID=A0A9J6GJZ5_HAELO|nr:hypothetical protein HPB48_020349 [Haemaphysalis longicornis]
MVKATKKAPYQIPERVVHQEPDTILYTSPRASNVQFFCEQQLQNALTTKKHTTPMGKCKQASISFSERLQQLYRKEKKQTQKRARRGV